MGLGVGGENSHTCVHAHTCEHTHINQDKHVGNYLQFLCMYFFGGLSLHLNHLIASCTANYNWPFGTLPFRLFG